MAEGCQDYRSLSAVWSVDCGLPVDGNDSLQTTVEHDDGDGDSHSNDGVGYQTLVVHGDEIITSLSAEPKKMADILHANQFISTECYEQIIELPATNTEKGRKMYISILKKVQHCPHQYAKFVSILNQHDKLLYGDLLRELENTTSTLQDSSKVSEQRLSSKKPSTNEQLQFDLSRSTNKRNCKIEEQIEKFNEKLQAIKMDALTELTESGVTLSQFRNRLSALPTSNRYEHAEFLESKFPLFEKAESFAGIFVHFSTYLSFIDFSLLEDIIKHFGSAALKQRMSRYANEIKEFRLNTTVKEVLPYLPHRKPKLLPDFSIMNVKINIDIDVTHTTLEDINQWRKEFASDFLLSEFTLCLLTIKKSSLMIVWLIPSAIILYLKKAIQNDENLILKNKILKLSINEDCVYPSKSTKNSRPDSFHEAETQALHSSSLSETLPAKAVAAPNMPQIEKIARKISLNIQDFCGLAISIKLCPIKLPTSIDHELHIIFAKMFHGLKFVTHVNFETAKQDLAHLMCAVGQHVQYPHSDFPIVVFVAGETSGGDINSIMDINISRDIVEPLLPTNAPQLYDNPKIFLINVISHAKLSKGKNRLHLPSGGNYILFQSVSDQACHFYDVFESMGMELLTNHGSIKEVMEAIDSPFKTIVSHLNKPVFIHPQSAAKRDSKSLTHPQPFKTHTTSPLSMPKGGNVSVVEQGLQSLVIHSPSKTCDTKPISTQSRDVQLNTPTKIVSEKKCLQGSCGMAFVVGIPNENSSQLSNNLVKEHVTILSQTFHTFGFAVFEKIGTTKAVLKDIVSKSLNLPNSQDYPIVLVVAGAAYQTSVNTSDSSDRNFNIRKDIVEPFLPPLAPHIASNPKIFLINTFTSPSELTQLETPDLNFLSGGNFLLSYTHTDHFSDLSKTYQSELTQSTDSLEDILTRVNDKLSPPSTKLLISRLTKPVHLVPVDQALTPKE